MLSNLPDEHRETRPSEPPATRLAFGVALSVQAVTLVVVAFGDIGFDKPGRFGLDFGHFLVLAVLWFGSLCMGFCMAWRLRQLGATVLQIAMLALPVLWFMTH